MIVKRFTDEVFSSYVTLLYGTHKEYQDWKIEKHIVDTDSSMSADNEDHMQGLSFKMDTSKRSGGIIRDYVIFMNQDDADFYTLLHETTHTIIKILDDRGIQWDGMNHEIVCYYQEFWFHKLWHFIGDKMTKKKVVKSGK